MSIVEDLLFLKQSYSIMEIKKKKQNELFVSVSRLIADCPLCNVSFFPQEVTVIGEDNRTQLLHATCNQCSSSVVILLLLGDTGLGSVGLVTDLTREDVAHFQRGNLIGVDDVLGLHQALQNDSAFCAAL